MASKAPENCGNCNEKLPKNGDYATCCTCGYGLHLDTCSIKRQTWNNLSASKQAVWVCAKCRKQKKGSTSQNDDDENNLTSNVDDDFEVSSLGVQKAILAKMNSMIEMKAKVDSIETSMKFIADKYDSLLAEVVALRTENAELKAKVEVLETSEKSNGELISKLSSELADLDQYGRRMNLEIHGLKVIGNLKDENINEVLEKVANDIGVNYQPEEIHQAHRLQPRRDGKPPTVIVQFFSKTSRDLWMKKGRNAKISNTFFNENLCYHYRQLLKEAKIRAKTHDYRFVWFSGGRVLARKRENENVIAIKTWNDLKKLK